MATTWRLLFKTTITGFPAIGEFILAATPGGPSLFTGGTAAASSVYSAGYTADLAFDNNPATLWSASGPAPEWLQYSPTTEISPVELRIAARNDGSLNGSPATFDLQNDKGSPGTFVTVQSYTAASWTSGQTQAFAVAAPAPVPGAVIVQTGVGFNVSGTVAMPTAPLDGNLLVALCGHYQNGFGAGAGWTEIYHTNANQDGISVLTRTASGDTALLTPSNNQTPNTIIIYEINGAGDGSIGRTTIKDMHDVSGISVTTTPTSTVAAGTLTFGAAFKAASPVELPTLSGPSNIVIDNSVASASTNRSVQGFHFTEAGSGGIAQAVTATYATSANTAMCLILFPLNVAAGTVAAVIPPSPARSAQVRADVVAGSTAVSTNSTQVRADVVAGSAAVSTNSTQVRADVVAGSAAVSTNSTQVRLQVVVSTVPLAAPPVVIANRSFVLMIG